MTLRASRAELLLARREWAAALVVGLVLLLGACEADLQASGPTVSIDRAVEPSGVADAQRDPAALLLDVGNGVFCGAALVALDVVVTARRCVAHTAPAPTCPAGAPDVGELRPASSLAVRRGADATHEPIVARGREIVATGSDTLCDHDIAFVVLDAPIPGIVPLGVSGVGIAQGRGVRTVTFGALSPTSAGATSSLDAGHEDFGLDSGTTSLARILRDHLAVLETSSNELLVDETGCEGIAGGPALDDATGLLVGVRSRPPGWCAAAGLGTAASPPASPASGGTTYTRIDTFASLLADALARGDAGAHDAGHHPLDADLGGACARGDDCASGVCVSSLGTSSGGSSSSRYCSRPCDAGDKCPSGFTCRMVDGASYCLST